MAKQTVIRAEKLFDGSKWHSNKTIVLEANKIIDLVTKKIKADYTGIVTPAFIDAHSHIGMFRGGEHHLEAEGNEVLQHISPLSEPINSVYFDDYYFEEAVKFGVLYSCIMPGSGNLFGGRSQIIRSFAKNRKEGLFCDYGYKMALGFNPRSTQQWKGDRPTTRMGIYSMLEKYFDDLILKLQKADYDREKAIFEINQDSDLSDQIREQKLRFVDREYDLSFTNEELAGIEILAGDAPVKIHVHKDDDVLYLLELVNKYAWKVSAEHLGNVRSTAIFNMLAKQDIPIVYGPLGSLAYKSELKDSRFDNAKYLMASKAHFGLMSDHPVISVTALRDSLKFFLIQGMKEEQALSLITSDNAEILNISDNLGRIEVGQLASVLVWDQDPLHLAAKPRVVIGEGKVLVKS